MVTGFEGANRFHRTIVVRATNMGGGRNRKAIEQQIIEKVYRLIDSKEKAREQVDEYAFPNYRVQNGNVEVFRAKGKR